MTARRALDRSACILGTLLLAIGACGESVDPPGPTSLEILQGPPAAGVPGDLLIDTLRVRLLDAQGTPQAGQSITWTILQGGGTVTAVNSTTDATGIASALWALGPVAGTNTVEARSPEDSAIVFQTTAEAFRVDIFDSNYGLACGLKSGDLWCWGQDSWVSNDPVSVGPFPFQYLYFRAPGLVSAGAGLTNLAVGFFRVCVTDLAGDVECLGPTGSVTPSVPSMRRIAGTDSHHFCGVATADSTAWCWDLSAGTAGQVSDSTQFITIEMDAQLGLDFTACGLVVDSTAACWGEGPLGDGTFNSSASPVPVSGGYTFIELAVGADFSCGLEPDGDVWCWGRNAEGQLGVASADSPVPLLVTSGVSLLAATDHTAMAIRFGTVTRWGYFGFDGGGHLPTPLASVAGLPVTSFSLNDNSCVGLVDGQVYCHDELHVHSSTVDIDRYTPIQPVVIP